ncbi:MAG: histone deacetylase [Chloroflexota bacterium]
MLPIIFHPEFVAPLPPKHRFPMPKFGKVYEWLVRDGIAGLDQFHIATKADIETLALVHTRAYIHDYLNGTLDAKAIRRIGFPWSAAMTNRTCTAVGGTILTGELALQYGIACSTAGGTHHAFADYGSGFCIFNDIAVAIRRLQQQGLAQKFLIVDLDAHQGDGTAHIFYNDPTVFTFSMHCAQNFPLRKQQSDLDIALPVNTGDADYIRILTEHLPTLLDNIRPDLVFYDAGVDPHVDDLLGKLALTNEGITTRDTYVLETCCQRGYPVACVVGGGYAKDIDQLARRHCLMHRAATDVYERLL